MDTVARHRMYVVLILMFFCMLFWAFFEQAGSSINNFTDRNVDRVFDRATVRTITASDVGQTSSSSQPRSNSVFTTATGCSP